jgi:ribosome-associated protein
LLARILEVLDDNKAEDIVTIDLAEKSPLADYMVVASGRSARQVQALADYVARAVKEAAGSVKVEGLTQGDWVLIDAGDVVVHLFRPEVREFYKVEAMWGLTTPETTHSSFVAQ